MLYHGTESERIEIQSEFNKTHHINNLHCHPIIITTYDVVRNDIKFLKSVDWKFITIDEGHKLKNSNAYVSKCVKYNVIGNRFIENLKFTNIILIIFRCMRQLSCTNKLILTGTPIQNDMTELWSLLNLLMPQLFNKLEDFNSWFVIDDFFETNDKIASMAKKDEILDTILKVSEFNYTC